MAEYNINLTNVQPTLVSGTNIKTINGESLLGSGDITTPTVSFGTSGQIPYTNATGDDYLYSSNLVWDSANSRLGIGTATPSGLLSGSSRVVSIETNGNSAEYTLSVQDGRKASFYLAKSINAYGFRLVDYNLNFTLRNKDNDSTFFHSSVGNTYLGGSGFQPSPSARLHVQGADNSTGVNTLLTSLDGTELFKVVNNGYTKIGSFVTQDDTNAVEIGTNPHYFYVRSNGTLDGEIGFKRIGGSNGNYKFMFDNGTSTYIGYNRPSQVIDIRSQFDITLTTGTTEVMRIDNSTNVSIGYGNTPTARLHIKGSGSTSATTSLLVQNSSSTELFKVLDNGNVGIGTTTPSYDLSIKERLMFSGGIAPTQYFVPSGNTNDMSILMNNQNGVGNERFGIIGNANNGWFTLKTGGSGYHFRVQTGNSWLLSSTRLIILQDGNVTIGNGDSSLGARLGVKGADNTTGVNTLLTSADGTELFKVLNDNTINLGGGSYSSRSVLNINMQSSRTYKVGGVAFPITFLDTGNNFRAVFGIKDGGNYDTYLNATSSGDFIFTKGVTTELARLTSTGLGIGTTSPTAKLHVKGSDNTTGVNTLLTSLDGTERFKVLNNGNVGIGATSPLATLHVSNAANTAKALFTHSTTDHLAVLVGSNGGGFAIEDNNYFAIWGQDITNAGTETGITERFRIDSSGNVGIGTKTPTAKLQVVGLSTYADNAAALAAGLTAGALYIRAGHGLDIVT